MSSNSFILQSAAPPFFDFRSKNTTAFVKQWLKVNATTAQP